MVFSETHLDFFNVNTGEWVQTLNVKRAKPLDSKGFLVNCLVNELPNVIQLGNSHQRKYFYIILYCDNRLYYVTNFVELCGIILYLSLKEIH